MNPTGGQMSSCASGPKLIQRWLTSYPGRRSERYRIICSSELDRERLVPTESFVRRIVFQQLVPCLRIHFRILEALCVSCLERVNHELLQLETRGRRHDAS